MRNHEYNTPDRGTTEWHIPLNENFKRLDSDVEVRDREEARGDYEPKAGAKFVAIDTGNRYVGDGSDWRRLPVPDRVDCEHASVADQFALPARSSDPADPQVGELWFRTDQNTLRVMTGDGPADIGHGDAEAPSVMFSEDFEESGWENLWQDTYKFDQYSDRYYRSTDHAQAGEWSLEVEFPEGEHYGCNATYIPTDAGDLDSIADEMWAQYWVYFSDPFQSSDNSHKLPGFKDTRSGYGYGGRVPEPEDGKRGWSMRASFSSADGDSVDLHDYTYWLDMEGSWGDRHGSTRVSTGTWHRIDQHVAMNTPGEYDGVLQMWVNGSIVAERTDMRWRESSDIGVHAWWFIPWYGGSDTSPIDQSLWFDGLRVDTRNFAGL